MQWSETAVVLVTHEAGPVTADVCAAAESSQIPCWSKRKNADRQSTIKVIKYAYRAIFVSDDFRLLYSCELCSEFALNSFVDKSSRNFEAANIQWYEIKLGVPACTAYSKQKPTHDDCAGHKSNPSCAYVRA